MIEWIAWAFRWAWLRLKMDDRADMTPERCAYYASEYLELARLARLSRSKECAAHCQAQADYYYHALNPRRRRDVIAKELGRRAVERMTGAALASAHDHAFARGDIAAPRGDFPAVRAAPPAPPPPCPPRPRRPYTKPELERMASIAPPMLPDPLLTAGIGVHNVDPLPVHEVTNAPDVSISASFHPPIEPAPSQPDSHDSGAGGGFDGGSSDSGGGSDGGGSW